MEFKNIQELMNQIKNLTDEDVSILQNLPEGDVFPVKMASDLHLLPSQVKAGLERLQGEGFLEQSQPNECIVEACDDQAYQINSKGAQAQALLKGFK
jgi:hypothetical protein